MKMKLFFCVCLLIGLTGLADACPDLSGMKITGDDMVSALNVDYPFSVNEIVGASDTILVTEDPSIKVTFIDKHHIRVKVLSSDLTMFAVTYVVYDTCGNSNSVTKLVTVLSVDFSKIQILQGNKVSTGAGSYMSYFKPQSDLCAGDTMMLMAVVKSGVTEMDFANISPGRIEVSDGLDYIIRGYTVILKASSVASGDKQISFVYNTVPETRFTVAVKVYQKIDLRNLSIDKSNVCRGTIVNLAAECYNASKVTWQTQSGKNIFSDTSLAAAKLKCDSLSDDVIIYTAKNVCGTESISKSIKIKQPFKEEIGVVTAFEDGNPYIAVAWNRTGAKATRYYEVLKEIETNVFESQTRKYFERDFGIWIDSNSNSSQQPYNYKLRTYDTCGNFVESEAIKSLHLTRIKQETQYAMYWNRYNSKASTAYTIYRVNPDYTMDKVGSVPATEGTDIFTYTISPPVPNAIYRIGYAIPEVKPKTIKTDSGPFSQSFSNMSESSLVSFSFMSKSSTVLYPNPARSEFVVSAGKVQSVVVLNLSGDVQWQGVDIDGSTSIPCAYWERGAYVVQIRSNGILSEYAIIIE